MYKQIKNIFKNKIIDNPSTINQNEYYYFYKDRFCKNFFGIKKDITLNEYELLKTIFVKKNIYSEDSQELYEFLYDNKPLPFKHELSFIIYQIQEEDEITVNNMIQDIYKNVKLIKYLNYNIAFGSFDNGVCEMVKAFGNDLGYEIKFHNGFKINKNTNGQDILAYINYYDQELNNQISTSLKDIIVVSNNKNLPLLLFIKNQILSKLDNTMNIKEVIETMLKNNLNVSQTAKVLYLHRTSLINRLDTIEKLTTLDIQNFQDAYAMKILLDLEEFDD